MEEMHALVKGRVHGVGFRAAARQAARALHLVGFVRNLSDGSVEIVAQGERNSFEQFLEALRARFGKEHIVGMEITFHPIQQVFTSFQVL